MTHIRPPAHPAPLGISTPPKLGGGVVRSIRATVHTKASIQSTLITTRPDLEDVGDAAR